MKKPRLTSKGPIRACQSLRNRSRYSTSSHEPCTPNSLACIKRQTPSIKHQASSTKQHKQINGKHRFNHVGADKATLRSDVDERGRSHRQWHRDRRARQSPSKKKRKLTSINQEFSRIHPGCDRHAPESRKTICQFTSKNEIKHQPKGTGKHRPRGSNQRINLSDRIAHTGTMQTSQFDSPQKLRYA